MDEFIRAFPHKKNWTKRVFSTLSMSSYSSPQSKEDTKKQNMRLINKYPILPYNIIIWKYWVFIYKSQS